MDTNHGSATQGRHMGWSGRGTDHSAVGINISASQVGTTDNLLLVIDDNAGHVQNLVIRGGFADYHGGGRSRRLIAALRAIRRKARGQRAFF
jgi:hypothetical protein